MLLAPTRYTLITRIVPRCSAVDEVRYVTGTKCRRGSVTSSPLDYLAYFVPRTPASRPSLAFNTALQDGGMPALPTLAW